MLVRARSQFVPFPPPGALTEWAWVWDAAEVTFLGAWEQECPRGWHLEAHSLPHSLMVFVHSGQARWRVGADQFVAGAGTLLFIPEGVRHAAVATAPLRATFVHFAARAFGVRCILTLLGFPHRVEGAGQFASDAHELARLSAWQPVGWKLRGQAIVTAWLLRCAHEYPHLFRPTTAPKDAKALKGLCPAFQLLASADGKVTVADLARAAMCSPTHLRRLFQKAVGMSPRQWLLEWRLRKAAHLLHGTDHSIQQIADACGFESLSHFTRYFKARFGLTPAQYRAHLQHCPPRGNSERR